MNTLWTKRMSVGNRIIDTLHKDLLDSASEIGDRVRVKDGQAIAEGFRMFEDRLTSYFTVEENIAQRVRFPFARHRQAHQKMHDQFLSLRDEFAVLRGLWSDDFGEKHSLLMRDRLIRHFTEESAQLKVVLDTHLYDLKPD